MRLSAFNMFSEKWYKLSQKQSDVIMINSGDTGILINDNIPNNFFSGISKVRFVNSIYNGAAGYSVGSGLVVAQLGVWQPVASAGYIRFVNDGNNNFTYEYKGNYPIEIGGFEVGFSTIDYSLFSQPVDFTPPVVIPPTVSETIDISDGVTYPMGIYFPVMSGGGRLKEVVMDMIKDPRKNTSSGTPYIYHRSTTSTANQAIMYNNAVFNRSIYTTEDGIGTITTNSGFTGVRFQIVLNLNAWSVNLMLSTTNAGLIGSLDNKISTGGDGAIEQMIFSATTY